MGGYGGEADNFQYSRLFLPGMDSDKHWNANRTPINLSHVDPIIVENVLSYLSSGLQIDVTHDLSNQIV